MKNVLFISYYWPPSGKATLHWPLYIMKHLPKFGWQSSVLTVEEDKFSHQDPSLYQDVLPETTVIKSKTIEPFDIYKKFLGKQKESPLVASETISKENKSLNHKISVWIRMNLFIPDARAGWYLPGVNAGAQYLRNNQVDAIVSIGPPHTSHLIGMRLAKKNNIPFIPVFIDPWTDIIYYKEHKRSALTLLIDNRLEKSVIDSAAHIVYVTETMKHDFARKYPASAEKSSVLYWGYNEEVFSDIKPYEWNEDGRVLVHAGNIFDYQNPLKFWEYLSRKNKNGAKIKIKFIGSVSPAIKRTIEEKGLSDDTEFLGFLPYSEMISRLMGADYLMVFPTEARHLPGKLFEYLRTGRPIIAFGDGNDEVKSIIERAGAGMFFSYRDDGSSFFEHPRFETDLNYARSFSREIISRQLSEILNNVTNTNSEKSRM